MSINPVKYCLNGVWYNKTDLECMITALELASGSHIKQFADLADTLLGMLGNGESEQSKQQS